MFSLPVHRPDISVFSPRACSSSPDSPQFSCHWLGTAPDAGLGCCIGTAQRTPWQCDKPCAPTWSSPLALTCPPVTGGPVSRSPQLWMRNNGFLFPGVYLGWWRAANPTQPLISQRRKVRLRHSPVPPSGFFNLHSEGLRHLPSFTSAPIPPQHYAVS